jgi:RHS repeat-associated protein
VNAQNELPFTEINVGVNDMGTAVANIPIECNAGRNGMKPQISIGYNSNIQQGVLGQNFTLNGISSINRGGKNFHTDNGVQKGVTHTQDDNFYLDGNKLILISGTYGALGSVYRTENDQFVKITLMSLNNKNTFIVETKEGNILQYSAKIDLEKVYTNDPTIEIGYFLEYSFDKHGNYMRYQYSVSEIILLDKIFYNGFDCSFNNYKPSCNTLIKAPNYFLNFYYQSIKTELINRSFTNGGFQTNNLKLTSVYNVMGTETIRSYSFNYNDEETNFFLQSIQCSNKEPITINWQQNETDLRVAGQIKTKANHFKAIGDFNGDGKTDILFVEGEINPNNAKSISVYGTNRNYNIITTDNNLLSNKTIMSGLLPFNTNSGNITNISVVDFDSDGDDDIILQEAYTFNGNAIYSYNLMKTELKQNSDGSIGFKEFVFIKNIMPASSYPGGIFTTIKYTEPFFVDLDGDGLPDLLEKTKSDGNFEIHASFSNNNYNSSLLLYNGLAFGSYKYQLTDFVVLDFNGNGKKDIFLVNNFVLSHNNSLVTRKAYLLEYDLQTNSILTHSNPISNSNTDNEKYHLYRTGDFNGDGKSDLLFFELWGENLWAKVGYSNGKDRFKIVDFEQIGLLDKIWCDNLQGTNQLMNYDFSNIGNNNTNNFVEIEIADFNNDGKDDIIERHDHIDGSFVSNDYKLHLGIRYNGGSTNNFNTISFQPNRNTTQNPSYFANHLLGDFDGDGKKDVLMIETANAQNLSNYVIEYHKNYSKVLKDIVTPKKTYTYFFEQLPKYNGFKKTLNPALSQGLSMSIPIKIVKSLTIETAITGTEYYNYYYKDLIYNRHGRGLLGFMEVIKTKQNSGTANITTVSKYEQNTLLSHQLNLATTKEYRHSSVQNGVVTPIDLISEVSYDYRLINTVPSKSDITFTFLSFKTETNYLNKNVKQTCFDYDIYGNLTHIASIYFPLNGNAPNFTYGDVIYSDATDYTYNQILTWLPSNVVTATNYKTRKDQLTIITPITYTYWSTNGLLKEKTTLANSSPNQTVEAFEYDVYGNVIKKGFNNKLNASSNYLRNTFIVYDAEFHFIDYTMNDLGHKTYFEFDKKIEKITKQTAPNGLITNYDYDVLGRLTETIFPNTNIELKSYEWNSSNSTTYYVITESNNLGDITKKHYNWKMQLVKEEKTPKYNAAIPSNMSVKTYSYNGYGLLAFESNWHNPTIPTSIIYSEYQYDIFNRLNLVKTNNIQVKKYEYNNNIITYTEGTNAPKETTLDATGLLTKVIEGGNLIKYTYNSNNQPISIDANGSILTYEYNDQNNLIKQCDPNSGCSETKYSPFGEVLETKDAKGDKYTFEYDAEGTLTKKTGINNKEYLYEYFNINLQADLNLPKTLIYKENGTIKNKLEYAYNGFGELIETKELAANNNTYTTTYTYDSEHRLDKTNYPNITIQNTYDDNNELLEISNILPTAPTNPISIWKNVFEHPDGRPIETLYGNGYLNSFTYDNNLNLSTLKSERLTPTTNIALHIGYQFDMANKNLIAKQYLKTGNSETFEYDNLDRLNKITLNIVGQSPQYNNIAFATNGNITEKYDAGKYNYNATKVNALASNSYHSSLSPVVIPATMEQAQAFTYTQSNKVATLTQDVKTLEMKYGFNDQRIHTLIKENTNNTTEIFYIASANMEIVNGTEITYLYAQGQPFAIHKKNVNETNCINYLHLDYQGSLMAITSQSGNIIEERNYDVWGRPRNPNTLEYVLPNPFGSGSPVKRGFTFHEHLEEFNLINMNGRMYDPLLARFLNADPLLQDNTDAQNYNRYSYVLNNPTKYTDPSGYAIQGAGTNYGAPNIIQGLNSAEESNQNYLDLKRSISRSYEDIFGRVFGGGGGTDEVLGFDSGRGNIFNPISLKSIMISGSKKSKNNLTPISGIDLVKVSQFCGNYNFQGSERNPITGETKGIGIENAPFSPLDIALVAGSVGNLIIKGSRLGYGLVSTAVRSALANRVGKRGFTEVGYQFQKHLSRGIGPWSNSITNGSKLNPSTFNQVGYNTFKEIWRAPGSFKNIDGFLEKRLMDGRGMRLQQDWRFKGFLDYLD